LTKSAAPRDPLEYLLDMMNDERVSRMQRQAIAKKIAPYFHPKPKPVPPGAAAATFASTVAEHLTEDEVESVAARREPIRRRLFKHFD
jgi:hypothetical protein